MYTLQIQRLDGEWEDVEAHNKSCDLCKGGPKGWSNWHGQVYRWVDESGAPVSFCKAFIDRYC